MYLLWFKLDTQLSSIKLPAHSPAGMREENGRVKVRKLSALGKGGLVDEAKAMCASKAKLEIHCFLSAGKCSAVSRNAELHHLQHYLGTQTPQLQMSLASFFFSPSFIAKDDMI